MKNKVNNDTYQFIGTLAIALYSQGINITLDALKQILNDQGHDYSDYSNLGIGKVVSSAYQAWKQVDPVVHHAIAFSYTGRHGNLVWDK